MKENRFFGAETPRVLTAMAFVFGLVLAGCASTPTNPGGGGNNDGTAQAAKLAKDLDAAKPGRGFFCSGG